MSHVSHCHVVFWVVLYRPGSAQKPGLGPHKHPSLQAGLAQVGLGSGPGFIGAVEDTSKIISVSYNETETSTYAVRTYLK